MSSYVLWRAASRSLNRDIRKAFARVETLPDMVITRRGLEIRRLQVHRCHDSRGLVWPGWDDNYNHRPRAENNPVAP